MIAMALGNLYGGRKADLDPNPDQLYGRIIIAAIWIAAIPVLGKYIIIGLSAVLIFAVNSNFLVIAAFIACMVIFVFPLFLLGTVTPSLVKYSVDSLDDSGSVVGKLNASNTIGSIIGTFVPTFVTIPAVGTSVTFLIFAGILLILAILYFVSGRTKPVSVAVGSVIFIIACITGYSDSFAFWENNLTYEGESIYNYLQVKENDRAVYLSTNVLFGVQSVYEKSDTLTGMYYDYAMAAPMMAGVHEKESLDVLILGMGTGTFATQCNRYFDGIRVEGVEIDEDITKLAREYFYLDESIPVVTYDGRAYLNAVEGTYDVIMVDAYQDITIPFQMSSLEFFTLVRDHLNPDGVMVVNMNMRGQKEGSITDYLSDTICRVFDEVYTVEVPRSTNRVLYASNAEDVLEVFERNVAMESHEDLKVVMGKVAETMAAWEAGDRIMTDDKAPVELLGMQVIDDIIKEEVSYYKEVYQENGLEGLMEVL
jgi:spermidine synthase